MKKALFLDRDGVINKMVKKLSKSYKKIMDDSPFDLSELAFNEGIKELVDRAKESGYFPIIITNQPGLIKEGIPMKNYEDITSEICSYLGLERSQVFECFHKEGFTMPCKCRKPEPGLFFMAKGMYNINLEESYMIGDSSTDMVAAKAAGVKKLIYIRRKEGEAQIGNHLDELKIPSLGIENLKIVNSLNEISFKESNADLNKNKLELGSGERPTPGYLHQDITSLPGVNLDFVCNPWEIPLEENSLSEVIALGLVEHLRFEEVEKTLKHMLKILEPGGSFLFDVPDMKIWSEYLYNLTHGESEKNPFPNEHIWNTVYGWQRWPGDEHKSGWTRESIISKVNSVGFSKVEEGVQIFTSKGIVRGRFTRKGDAHIYIKATK